MFQQEILRQQLIKDLEHLHHLILQYALGNRAAKRERDQLEAAVQIKIALWRTFASKFPP